MKTKWDYTKLADAYLKRPDYDIFAIDKVLSTVSVDTKQKDKVLKRGDFTNLANDYAKYRPS